MNKEYTYINGKVIIEDCEGNYALTEYYDNLDEVLIQENLLETIEDRIIHLENTKQNDIYNSNHYIPIIFPTVALATIFGTPVLSYIYGNHDIFTTSINTIFGNVNKALWHSIVFSSFSLPLGGFIDIISYKKYKNNINNRNALNSELYFLKEVINYERKKLEELKQNKTTNNENKEFRVVELNNLELLHNLRNRLKSYSSLGYNLEEYYQYYLDGKLEEILKKENYTNADIELAQKFLKETTLIKRKRKS